MCCQACPAPIAVCCGHLHHLFLTGALYSTMRPYVALSSFSSYLLVAAVVTDSLLT